MKTSHVETYGCAASQADSKIIMGRSVAHKSIAFDRRRGLDLMGESSGKDSPSFALLLDGSVYLGIGDGIGPSLLSKRIRLFIGTCCAVGGSPDGRELESDVVAVLVLGVFGEL